MLVPACANRFPSCSCHLFQSCLDGCTGMPTDIFVTFRRSYEHALRYFMFVVFVRLLCSSVCLAFALFWTICVCFATFLRIIDAYSMTGLRTRFGQELWAWTYIWPSRNLRYKPWFYTSEYADGKIQSRRLDWASRSAFRVAFAGVFFPHVQMNGSL